MPGYLWTVRTTHHYSESKYNSEVPLNDTWISLRGQQALRLELKSVSASRGIGIGQLRFELDATAKHEIADGAPFWISGELSITNFGAQNGYLAPLRLVRQPLHLPSGRGSATVHLNADVSHTQLQVIEDNRVTSVQFALDLYGHLLVEGKPEAFFGSRIERDVRQSDWIALIEQMNHRRIMLIEIDSPDTASMPTVALANTYFQAAQKHYMEHEWRLAVESVRQCLGALVDEDANEEKSEAEVKQALKDIRAKSRQENVGYMERYEPIRRALKFHADLGAHPEVVETTKRHAYAALLMAAGLLQGFGHSN